MPTNSLPARSLPELKQPPIDLLIQAIQESAKYRCVCPEAIRRIGLRELASRNSLKEAVKETKNTLHQIAGAYLDGKMRYQEKAIGRRQKATEEKPTAQESTQGGSGALESEQNREDGDVWRVELWERMRQHASTAERLPILERFYATLLAPIIHERPIRSVLDVACGLNPLAIPWMGLEPDCVYYACDLFTDMIAFLNHYFAERGIHGEAFTNDVLTAAPTQQADIAFVLKLLPVLEQWNKNAGLELLRALNADWRIVSFPTRSLGGHGSNRAANYAARFLGLIADEPWQVTRYDFDSELVFVLDTRPM